MKKIITKISLMSLALIALTVSAEARLIKIDNEVYCSAIPKAEHKRDKFIANLPDNALISCGMYVYSVKNKSWYVNDFSNFTRKIKVEKTK